MKLLKTSDINTFLSRFLTNKNMSKYDMSNILSVVWKGEKSYFNLCKTITIKDVDKIPQKYYSLYKVIYGDTWTNISYKFYNTIKLWWLICKFNDIKNPFELLYEGKVLKIPNLLLVNQIIMTLQ